MNSLSFCTLFIAFPSNFLLFFASNSLSFPCSFSLSFFFPLRCSLIASASFPSVSFLGPLSLNSFSIFSLFLPRRASSPFNFLFSNWTAATASKSSERGQIVKACKYFNRSKIADAENIEIPVTAALPIKSSLTDPSSSRTSSCHH